MLKTATPCLPVARYPYAAESLLQTLEPRVLLAAFTAAQFDYPINGASANGAYLWSDVADVLISGDTVTPYSDLFGGLVDPLIRGISNDGLIAFTAAAEPGGAPELYLRDGDTVATLASLITQAEGGPETDNFSFIAMSSAGHIALTSLDPALAEPDGNRPVWVFDDGLLSYLFSGGAVDVNASGVVVGYRSHTAGTIMASRDGGVTTLDFPLSAPYAINDAGDILGATSGMEGNPNLAILRDGVLTDIGHPGDGTPDRFAYRAANVFFDNAGRVVANYYGEPGGFPYIRRFIWTQADGFEELDTLIPGENLDPNTLSLVPLDDGRIVVHDLVLSAVEEADLWVLREGSPTASMEVDGFSHFVGINQFDEVVAFRRDAAGNTTRVRLSAVQTVGDVEIALAQPPSTSQPVPRAPWLFILESGTGRIARTGVPAGSGPVRGFTFESTPIIGSLTAFTTAAGVVHAAGLDAAGDVIIEYRVGFDWATVNLSETHIRAQDLVSPTFSGPLTSYTTSWDGQNIAGVDENGQIHVVWWAPGLGPLWRVDNLSAIAGTPAVTGPLTAYLTPWSGINLAATDAEGDLIVTWWAPGVEWSSNDLTAITGGPRLAAGSLASYVTPWGGLNVVGTRADTGDTVVYWWAPGAAWTAEPIIPEGSDEAARVSAPSAHATADGVLNIFGRGGEGDTTPTLLTWSPAAPVWRLLNLLEPA